jgi:MtrB/PioB family decaheme-associated outer membrane protein
MIYSNRYLLLNTIAILLICNFSASVVADGFRLQDANLKNLNKTKWKCKYCLFTPASQKKVSVGLRHGSSQNGHFSSLTGDNHQGVGIELDANIETRTKDKHYRLFVQGVGKSNNQVRLSAAKSNSYKVAINYHEFNRFGHIEGITPFVNAGEDSLTLPVNWQHAATTTEMPINNFTTFANTLERQYWQVQAEKDFTKNWQAYIDVQTEDKRGITTTSGNILTKAVILPSGIDQNHQQFELGSYMALGNGSLLVNYYQSKFSNQRSALNWQSPYSYIFWGADSGQLSTAPDNQMNQLSLFGNYRFSNLNLQARFSYGLLKQDQSFLPYSSNSTLDTGALPTNNLNGEVKVFSSHFKALYRADKSWRLSLNYLFDEHDNNTQVETYQHVLSDSVLLADNATNRAYSFNKEQIKLKSQWRFSSQSKLVVGLEFDQRQRDLHVQKITKDKKFWVKVSTHTAAFNHISLQLSSQFRDGNAKQRTAISEQVNPLSRVQKYFVADRNREEVRGRLSFNAYADTQVSLLGYFYRDKYSSTDFGLIESKRRGLDFSANKELSKNIFLSVYMHNQWQDNTSQNGFQYSHNNWLAINNDKTDTSGLSVVAEKLADGKLTLTADYNYSYAKGLAAIDQLSHELNDEHTEIIMNAQDIKLSANYAYSKHVELYFNLLYQKFEDDDWRSQYNANRIVNVLGNGLSGYDYDAHRMTIGLSYQF